MNSFELKPRGVACLEEVTATMLQFGTVFCSVHRDTVDEEKKKIAEPFQRDNARHLQKEAEEKAK